MSVYFINAWEVKMKKLLWIKLGGVAVVVSAQLSAVACERPPIKDYQYSSCYDNDVAVVYKNDRPALVHRSGRVVDLPYASVGDFYEGLAYVGNDDGKYGVMDTRGQFVVPLDYDDVGDFHEGLAYVEKNEKYGFINKKGKVVIPVRYDDVGGRFQHGVTYAQKGEKYGLINQKNRTVAPFKFDFIRRYDEHLWHACTIKETEEDVEFTGYYIDNQGNISQAGICDYY